MSLNTYTGIARWAALLVLLTFMACLLWVSLEAALALGIGFLCGALMMAAYKRADEEGEVHHDH